MKYCSIAAAAKELEIPVFAVRTMHKEGRCPGFSSASRFYVAVDLLRNQLERECLANAGKEVTDNVTE